MYDLSGLLPLIATAGSVFLSPLAEEATGTPLWFWVLMALILVALPILALVFGPRFQAKERAQAETAAETVAEPPADAH